MNLRSFKYMFLLLIWFFIFITINIIISIILIFKIADFKCSCSSCDNNIYDNGLNSHLNSEIDNLKK